MWYIVGISYVKYSPYLISKMRYLSAVTFKYGMPTPCGSIILTRKTSDNLVPPSVCTWTIPIGSNLHFLITLCEITVFVAPVSQIAFCK